MATATDHVEAGRQLKPSSSRISLPYIGMHPPGTADAGADRNGPPSTDEDFPWGPSHPCYPHLNPHVPFSSPLHASTRIIRIKRDWMAQGDLAPQFANLYPEVLDPLVSEEEFRVLIRKVNSELAAGFSPWTVRAWVDSLMGVATGWVWEDLGLTGVKGRLRALEAWIENWNEEVGFERGVKIIELRRSGYLTLDIQIPDPEIAIEPTGPSRPVTQAADSAPTIDFSTPFPSLPDVAKLRHEPLSGHFASVGA